MSTAALLLRLCARLCAAWPYEHVGFNVVPLSPPPEVSPVTGKSLCRSRKLLYITPNTIQSDWCPQILHAPLLLPCTVPDSGMLLFGANRPDLLENPEQETLSFGQTHDASKRDAGACLVS